MNYKYPLFWPFMNDDIKRSVASTLETRWLGQGPQVDEFEDEVEKRFGVKYAVSVSSGSAALETAYDLIDLKPGDEVIVPVLTCTATSIPLIRKGVTLVFADIDKKTLCPSIQDISSKITPRTKAIVTVHLGGIECPLSDVEYPFINGTKIPVVDDAAQAFGIFKGDYTAVSFQAIKFFTTGDGGMFFCKNENDYRKAKLMRWFGIDREKKRDEGWQSYKSREMTSDIEIIGYKRQMTDIAASMGRAGLRAYDRIIAYRKSLFEIYRRELIGVDGIRVVDGENNLCWLATVIVENRDSFAKMLKEKGVETNLVQLRNDIYTIFGGHRRNLPNMNELEDKYTSLPLNTHITKEDVREICSFIKGGW